MKYQSLIITNSNKNLKYDYLETVSKLLDLEENKINKDLMMVIKKTEKATRIGIEQTRVLIEWNAKKSENGIKLAIIDNAEELSDVSQNSLLKLLEEPEESTLLVLITSNPDTLIETIVSRCKIVHLDEEFLIDKVSKHENLMYMNFFERKEYLEKLSTQSRKEIQEQIGSILKSLVETRPNSGNFTTVLRNIEQIYVGIGRGTNIKASLNSLNLEIEMLQSE